jgi:hypothetical protein
MEEGMTYVVIENTPGYLPENDDPFTTDDIVRALDVIHEDVERYVDHLEETGERYSVSWSDGHHSCFVSIEKPHDLGRVFEIVEQEPTCGVQDRTIAECRPPILPHSNRCGICGREVP